jgi:aerobic-type carbon monoxide dehydrogenase small subunit (CoxS/CutS family)
MKITQIRLNVNGEDVTQDCPPDITLADFLHEKLGLTGTKVSCGVGVCKACTVAVREPGRPDLQRIQACLTPASALIGSQILTVEGIANGPELSDAQTALLRNFSFQCGYCTPGFLMGIVLLIDKLKTEPAKRGELNEIIAANLGEHICRCSGYVKYYDAIKEILEQTPGLVVG